MRKQSIGPTFVATLALLSGMPAGAMGLEEAVEKAIAHSPQVRSAEAQERAAGTDVDIAKGGYYPSVSVGVGPRTFSMEDYAYDLTFTQMLYDWGRVRGVVDSAKAVRGKMSEELRLKWDQTALDVIETYLDILETQQQIAALQSHLGSLESIREMTVWRSQGGYSDRSEPERADLEIARISEQLAIQRGTLNDAESQFRLLTGEEPRDLSMPNSALLAGYLDGQDIESLVSAAPAARVASADTAVAQADLKQARASLFPQLNVEVSSARRDIGGILQEDTTVALRLRVNGFQGPVNFLRPRGAQQRVEAAIWNEGAVQRDTRREVQTLLDNAKLIREREPILARQVDSADQIGRTYLDQFGVGRRDVVDLLNNKREEHEVTRQLIAMRIDLLRVQYRAASKLGLLGPIVQGRAG